MPYTPSVYTAGGPQTYIQANNAETQYAEATLSFEQDLFTPFVYGLGSFVATKNGTTASQLDVTAGVAFLLQTDSTLRRRAPVSSTQSTTGHPSTTMFLDLNPDGTWSWGTSHSGVSGHLTIASVTTDSSANIAAVTDARTLSTTLLGSMGANGSAYVSVSALGLLAPDLGAGVAAQIGHLDGTNGVFSNAVFFNAPLHGASAQGFYFAAWTGAATVIPFSVGGRFGNALAYVDNSGNITGGNITGGVLSGASASLAGGMSAGSTIFQQGSSVGLTGSHSVAQIALSYGSGAPASLNSNEIYFQIS